MAVAPASEQDGPQAPVLVDEQPPKRLLGDTAYGIGPVRADLKERSVDVLAPVPEAPRRRNSTAPPRKRRPDRRAAEPLDRTACRPLGVSTRVTSGEPPVAGNTPATSEFL